MADKVFRIWDTKLRRRHYDDKYRPENRLNMKDQRTRKMELQMDALAFATGINLNTLYRIERGQDPKLSEARRISIVLNSTVEELWDWSPEHDEPITETPTWTFQRLQPPKKR